MIDLKTLNRWCGKLDTFSFGRFDRRGDLSSHWQNRFCQAPSTIHLLRYGGTYLGQPASCSGLSREERNVSISTPSSSAQFNLANRYGTRSLPLACFVFSGQQLGSI